jgi:hypothetical protein
VIQHTQSGIRAYSRYDDIRVLLPYHYYGNIAWRLPFLFQSPGPPYGIGAGAQTFLGTDGTQVLTFMKRDRKLLFLSKKVL